MTGFRIFPHQIVARNILIISVPLKLCFPAGRRRLGACFLLIKLDADVHFFLFTCRAQSSTRCHCETWASRLRCWIVMTALSSKESIDRVINPERETDGFTWSIFVFCVESCLDRFVRNRQHGVSWFCLFPLHFHLTMNDTINTKNQSTWMYQVFCVCVCVGLCINLSDLWTSGNELESSRRSHHPPNHLPPSPWPVSLIIAVIMRENLGEKRKKDWKKRRREMRWRGTI